MPIQQTVYQTYQVLKNVLNGHLMPQLQGNQQKICTCRMQVCEVAN